jgi:hypothetical protein
MLPDEDVYQKVRKYRARERLLGALLGFCALGSSMLYVVFLRSMLSWLWIILLIAIEWVVMLFVFLIITRQMRRRK